METAQGVREVLSIPPPQVGEGRAVPPTPAALPPPPLASKPESLPAPFTLQAECLFGRLGTHSKIAGAWLQLLDPFHSDHSGRKLVVKAPSRAVAASAISAVLFQLCHDLQVGGEGLAEALRGCPYRLVHAIRAGPLMTACHAAICSSLDGEKSLLAAPLPSPPCSLHRQVTTPLEDSGWSYIDEHAAKQGPFKFGRMVKWGQKGELEAGLRVEDQRTSVWVPLWYLLAEDEKRSGAPAAGACRRVAGRVGVAALPLAAFRLHGRVPPLSPEPRPAKGADAPLLPLPPPLPNGL